MEEVILIGGGGHCASVIDTMRRQSFYKPAGILDIPEKAGTSVSGIPIIGVDADMSQIFKKGIHLAFITLGSIGDTDLREKLVQKAEKAGFRFPVIQDPSAVIAEDASLGEGTFVGKNVVVNVQARIGKHTIINTGSIVEHECKVGNFVHLAPGSTLSGGVEIGNRTHIGTNSTIIQGVSIGPDALIGAGSVVLRDVGAGKKAYGNPCREVII